MPVVRYWTARGGRSLSPLGEPSRVLTSLRDSERVFRSVATWAGLNGLAFRVGVCEDPTFRAEEASASLVELSRVSDGELVHVTYARKVWSYMHVVHRTSSAANAESLMRGLVSIGRGIGRCENNRRDITEPLRAPPYFVYVLTGKLPPKNEAGPRPEKAAPTSLLSLAEL